MIGGAPKMVRLRSYLLRRAHVPHASRCSTSSTALPGIPSQIVNFAVVARSELARIVAFANERGWRRLRLLSSAGNSYNRDYHGETATGMQRPMLNVFLRDGGTIRHVWGSANVFDLTPEGRPIDWDEQLSYP